MKPYSTSPLIIRPFAQPDLPSIRSLFIRVNRDLLPAHLRTAFERHIALSLRDEIDVLSDAYNPAHGHRFWVADRLGAIAGMVGLQRVDSVAAEIRRMYVDPACRRQGIACALLTHAEIQAMQSGYRRLVLSTSELQAAAIELYEREGYRLVSVHVAEAQDIRTIGGGIKRYRLPLCSG